MPDELSFPVPGWIKVRAEEGTCNPAYCDLARRRVESVPYTLFSGASSTTGAAR